MRIAGIVAPNFGLGNTGMVSVDLALASLCNELPERPQLDLYCLALPTAGNTPLRSTIDEAALPLQAKSLLDHLDDVVAHDRIVYWGDFPHARHWHHQGGAGALRRMGYTTDREGALPLLRRALMLADAPDDVLERVIVYGGTIINNNQSDYLDTTYHRDLERLAKGARLVLMRDLLSAMKIANLRGTFDVGAHVGTDCALLLGDGILDGLPRTSWSGPRERTAGIFVGARSSLPLPSLIRRSTELATRLQLEPQWLPWLPKPPDEELVAAALPDLGIDRSPHTLGDLFAVLRRHQLIITDTYHCCINAWRAGVPALCIGSMAATHQSKSRTLGDLKKFMFYAMYDALDFYIDATELADESMWSAKLDLLSQPGLISSLAAPVLERMRAHAEQSRQRLHAALG